MTRLINIEDAALLKTVADGGLSAKALWRRINAQPTIDAVPVRHGKWIKEFENEDGRNLRCSECRMVFYVGKGRDGNYCPNCGARMDEE